LKYRNKPMPTAVTNAPDATAALFVKGVSGSLLGSVASGEGVGDSLGVGVGLRVGVADGEGADSGDGDGGGGVYSHLGSSRFTLEMSKGVISG
jgi:hypothetical protein